MWTLIDSPIDQLRLVEHDGAITAIEFSPLSERPATADERDDADALLVEGARQLRAYFAGELTAFDLPIALAGTAFQQRVWAQLPAIGYGTTTSYGEIARRLGLTSGAARAVGSAVGANPVPIVVPCHRVIGSNGALTGYAGGLPRKQKLLDLEAGLL